MQISTVTNAFGQVACSEFMSYPLRTFSASYFSSNWHGKVLWHRPGCRRILPPNCRAVVGWLDGYWSGCTAIATGGFSSDGHICIVAEEECSAVALAS